MLFNLFLSVSFKHLNRNRFNYFFLVENRLCHFLFDEYVLYIKRFDTVDYKEASAFKLQSFFAALGYQNPFLNTKVCHCYYTVAAFQYTQIHKLRANYYSRRENIA